MDEINATGAVLAGRRTVEQVDHWGGNHHGVPIFVPVTCKNSIPSRHSTKILEFLKTKVW
jgi:hypothetical protein